MNAYHITSEKINVVGFTKLREKCEAEQRNGRTIDRNLLINADAQKLIGQLLGAKKGYLSKTRCDMFLDNHTASSLTFVAEINEGTRIYADKLKLATERGCIDSVQREAVATLLNRITAGAGDIDRRPAAVRARIKARIMFSGKPKTIDDFIEKYLSEVVVIVDAYAEEDNIR
ncbi:hypothetical protein B484DRAFT_409309 [Ochromonadaceae sp. CCMP2298]|nr:hypothetical protein B484DRAFT_409309 [Ochromonadaceae sp. CCMP2298]